MKWISGAPPTSPPNWPMTAAIVSLLPWTAIGLGVGVQLVEPDGVGVVVVEVQHVDLGAGLVGGGVDELFHDLDQRVALAFHG